MIEKYLAPGENSWSDIATRVAQVMPLNEQDEIRDAIICKKFYPGTPILRNAGSSLNMLSCHSWIVKDSIEGIFEAATVAALVYKSGGGGIGLDLSELQSSRTQLKYISSDEATAAGPLGFWPLFVTTGEVIGKWRSGKPSGSMGTLSWSHPDARMWASCKRIDGCLSESNLTITIDNWSDLPYDDKMYIAENAWRNGTPGLAFLNNANEHNPVLQDYGRLTTLNVCSEVIGYHATTCLLSSLNLPFVIKKLGDWNELRSAMRLQVRLLDRIIDINHYPHREFQQQAQRLRQIGCGIMGWADLLKREGIEYASDVCNELADEIGKELEQAGEAASWELADEKGGYMNGRPRNAFKMSIAPNGHIAPLAGVSPSICLDFNDSVEYAQSLELSPEKHIRHLAAWAQYIDSGISFTLPLQHVSTKENVLEAISLAHERGIKTISFYRDGSRVGQPCNINGDCE